MDGPGVFDDMIRRALSEDAGRGDVTSDSIIPRSLRGEGVFRAGEDFILAGRDICGRCFTLLDPALEVRWDARDGDEVAKGRLFGRVAGPARPMLTAERVSLNFLQHLSGIATLTHRLVRIVEGRRVRITDTRKTLPGLRACEKYAVRMGGGWNHRSGLDDGILIKDNHISLAGGVAEAVRRVRAAAHHLLKVEVEADSLEKVREALEAGADVIMLDNMGPEQVKEALEIIGKKIPVEISGRMDADKIAALAGLPVQYISVGALTHSARAVDISFSIQAMD
jgi:nicotinate-nucleotide pyrophosphorylase (carboxylating)